VDRQQPHNDGMQLAGRMYIQRQLSTALGFLAENKQRPQVGWLVVLEDMYYAACFGGESNGTL
jgi:hypothetical protein